MRSQALNYLACPCCGGKLVADADETDSDGHIMQGTLVSGCGARFPIHHGVPRLARQNRAAPWGGVHDSLPQPGMQHPFADRWLLDAYARTRAPRLLERIAPLVPEDFAGRAILEVGCGRGEHTVLMAGFGARDVVAVDDPTAPTLDGAFAATRHLPNVHIIQGDTHHLPVGRWFDVGVALGALSWMPDPGAGFRGLCDCIATGGRLALWVHCDEPRAGLTGVVESLRRSVAAQVADILPSRPLWPLWPSWLAWPTAALLSVAARVCRDNPLLADRLPHGADLRALGHLPARAVHDLLADQMRTPPARYLRRAEVEDWFQLLGLEDAHIAWHADHICRATARISRCDQDDTRPAGRRA